MFILDVAKKLNSKNIHFAVVGGFAVALHGVVRGTIDLDIILNIEKANFVKFELAARELGLVSKLPVSAEQVFNFRKEYIEEKNLVAWSFFHPKDPLQVLDVIITEDLKKQKVKHIKYMGVDIKVLDIDPLIKMKEKSGRPQDLEDVAALKRLAHESKS